MAIKILLWLSLLTVSQGVVIEVQQHRAEENATARKAGSCECQSWAEVYYKSWAYCGRGNELYFLSKYGFSSAYAATEPISGLPHKMCYDFFKNFLAATCVNIDLYPLSGPDTSKNGEQWCYVSNDCTDLNGGGFATNQQGFAQGAWHNLQTATKMAWKKCAAGDNMLKTKQVPDVVAMGLASDVSLSRLLRLAYPTVAIDWGEAAFFYETLNEQYKAGSTLQEMIDAVPTISGWGSRIEDVHTQLRTIAASGEGYVLDSPGHGDNFVVVQGRAAYSVDMTANWKMAYLAGKFSKEFSVTCIMGCAQAERRDAVDLTTM